MKRLERFSRVGTSELRQQSHLLQNLSSNDKILGMCWSFMSNLLFCVLYLTPNPFYSTQNSTYVALNTLWKFTLIKNLSSSSLDAVIAFSMWFVCLYQIVQPSSSLKWPLEINLLCTFKLRVSLNESSTFCLEKSLEINWSLFGQHFVIAPFLRTFSSD